jgi:hypothetical protein
MDSNPYPISESRTLYRGVKPQVKVNAIDGFAVKCHETFLQFNNIRPYTFHYILSHISPFKITALKSYHIYFNVLFIVTSFLEILYQYFV